MKTTLTSDSGAVNISFHHYSPDNTIFSNMTDETVRLYLKKKYKLSETRKITFKEILKVREFGSYKLFNNHPFTKCYIEYINTSKNINIKVEGSAKVFDNIRKVMLISGKWKNIGVKDHYNRSEGRKLSLENAVFNLKSKLVKLLITDNTVIQDLPSDLKKDEILKIGENIDMIMIEIIRFYYNYIKKSMEKTEATKLKPSDLIEIKNKTFDIETLGPKDNKMLITVIDVKATDDQQNPEKLEPVTHRN